MTVLASNLLIIIIALCFHKQKVILSIGYKLVTIFLILTVVRSVVPFEMPIAKNVYFPKWLSAIVAVLRHEFFTIGSIGISIWFFMGLGWIVGSLYHIYKLIQQKRFLDHYIVRYGINVTNIEPYKSAMLNMESHRFKFVRRRPIQLYQVLYLGAPMQVGTLYPCILLPYGMNLSEEKIVYILRHEAAHFYRHDTLIKDVTSVICAIYWWNPLSQRLKHQIDLLAEMHVDSTIIDNDDEKRTVYYEILRELAIKNQGGQSPVSSINTINRDLQYRFDMMFSKRKLNVLLLLTLTFIILLIYIGSYRITFEAHYMLPQHAEVADSIAILGEDIYAVPLEDGTYDIYIYGIYDTNTDTLEQYRGIQIKQP